MSRKIFLICLTILLPILAGCPADSGKTAAPLSIPELKEAIGAKGKPTLIFFLNPRGGPCQAQNGILKTLHEKRNGDFNVAFVDATNPNHQQAFYDYGVRNLPSLVLVNKAGKISRVFPPGIQDAETVSAAIEKAK